MDEVVSFTGTLANTGEHRNTTVVLGHALNHFLNQNGFTDTGATKQTDFSTLDVGREQVDDLDAGLE